jgi:hypothetical protein
VPFIWRHQFTDTIRVHDLEYDTLDCAVLSHSKRQRILFSHLTRWEQLLKPKSAVFRKLVRTFKNCGNENSIMTKDLSLRRSAWTFARSRNLVAQTGARTAGYCKQPGNMLQCSARLTVPLNKLLPGQPAGSVAQQDERSGSSLIMVRIDNRLIQLWPIRSKKHILSIIQLKENVLNSFHRTL